MRLIKLFRVLAGLCAALPGVTRTVHAQAGPPFLSNDPGTPGNANWEINLAAAQTLFRGAGSYQVPQIDLNFGVGERIQLTYEIPYIIETQTGQPVERGWGNALPGVKWRFLDQGEDGWQLSVFPQLQTGLTTESQQRGLGEPGPRYLLPVEASRKLGPVEVDFEAGYYFPVHGRNERILGLVVGHDFTHRFELDSELYDDRVAGAFGPHATTLDVGGRYKLGRGFIALFMAGRSIGGNSSAQPQFIGYFGVQILLSDYGLKLNAEP
jgi:hypothetical protein